MTIAISTGAAFDIETYDGLIAYIVAHLQLDAETEGQVPTFIRSAEYELNRMVLAPERETTGVLTYAAGDAYQALPSDFRQLRTAYLDGEYPLSQVTLNVLGGFLDSSGKPQVFTIAGQAVHVGPVPDAAYTLTLTYIADIPSLSPTNQTNWLLSTNADAYVYATLREAEAFLGNDARIQLFEYALQKVMGQINQQGNRYRNSGPIRLRSPVVV